MPVIATVASGLSSSGEQSVVGMIDATSEDRRRQRSSFISLEIVRSSCLEGGEVQTETKSRDELMLN